MRVGTLLTADKGARQAISFARCDAVRALMSRSTFKGYLQLWNESKSGGTGYPRTERGCSHEPGSATYKARAARRDYEGVNPSHQVIRGSKPYHSPLPRLQPTENPGQGLATEVHELGADVPVMPGRAEQVLGNPRGRQSAQSPLASCVNLQLRSRLCQQRLRACSRASSWAVQPVRSTEDAARAALPTLFWPPPQNRNGPL